jgi:hypothetical protein
MSGPAVSSEHWKRRVTSREEGVDVERERFLGGTAMGVGGERLPPAAAARTGLDSSIMRSHLLRVELAETAGLGLYSSTAMCKLSQQAQYSCVRLDKDSQHLGPPAAVQSQWSDAC